MEVGVSGSALLHENDQETLIRIVLEEEIRVVDMEGTSKEDADAEAVAA